MSYTMTPAECRSAYNYPSNRRSFDTLEAFARAMGVDLDAEPSAPKHPTLSNRQRVADLPAAKAKAAPPPPKPAHLAGDMTGEFRRALERMKTDTHQTETQAMTNKQPSGDAEARRKWDSDPQLRAEFGDDFERYQAYAKAVHEGKAKVLANGGRSYG